MAHECLDGSLFPQRQTHPQQLCMRTCHAPATSFHPNGLIQSCVMQDSLDSWGWINPGNTSACYEQQTQLLPPQFFAGGWVYYNGGYQIPCNR